jgi:glyoxylase-like metal-dependent hydrolase (beta-lactamase superfamily II)
MKYLFKIITKIVDNFYGFLGIFHPVDTGKINKYLYTIKNKNVNFFIYTDGENTICIDAGNPDVSIKKELKKINIKPESITHLFLTHTDVDHAGGFYLFKNAKIYFGKDDEQMINGTTPRAFKYLHSPKIDMEYNLLQGGEIINIGKIKVKAISTPGHTPGSMAFLVNNSILFTGDTLILRNGKAYPLNYPYNMNNAMVRESIKKLALLENISILCTGHTGYTVDYKKSME